MKSLPFTYWVADSETYPNVYLTCFRNSIGMEVVFEISNRKNESRELIEFFRMIANSDSYVVTFNGLGFDYPIWHMLMKMGYSSAQPLYEKAQSIITSPDDDRFAHLVYPSDRYFKVLDIYRMKHYTNKARSTSLKALEFSMRMDNISDLPFPVGTVLNSEQIDKLIKYCRHDVEATLLFMNECASEIDFRFNLIPRLGEEVVNADDTKIGAEIFRMELEKAGVQCYEYGQTGRKPKQTHRDKLVLRDAILPWIELETPGFKRILEFLRGQVITETKGVFEGLIASEYGLDVVFGTGGLHAAVQSKSFIATDTMLIESRDVSSYYPNLSIKNNFYPEHLGPKFCEIYKSLYEQRKTYKKGTTENAAYKLSLNGTYGKSNDKFSVFYDPLFTLKITLNGQLLLCLLVENLMKIPTVQVVMINTDGLEYTIHPDYVDQANQVCDWWCKKTGLELEGARYAKLFIRDCNNYIGQFDTGAVKRKGAYEYDLDWHQNASALVVPKVAEQVLVYGKPMRETLENWPDRMDFMCRVKVPRGSRLELADGTPLENTQRYYVAKSGQQLVKIMPPLKGKSDERRFNIESGWGVCPCNDIKDAVLPIEFNYYIQEVEKLCLSVM